MCSTQNTNKSDRKSGMTLPEVLIAMIILLIITGVVLNFVVEGLKASYISEQRNLVNSDTRQFTRDIIDDASTANYFLIYNSFANGDRDAKADRVTDGVSGDFLLLVYLGDYDSSIPGRPIEKIVGYFRDTVASLTSNNTAPIRRFEVSYSPASSSAPEALIPDASNASTYDDLVDQAKGFIDGKFFYNYGDKSIMMNGSVVRGNNAERVKNAYNFVIAPRI